MRELCGALFVICAACTSEYTFLPHELEDGDRLAVFTLDATGIPREGRVISTGDEPARFTLDEGMSLVRAKLPRGTFLASTGADPTAIASLAIKETVQPIDSPIACGETWPVAPALVYPGDLCPFPPFVTLERDRVESMQLVPAPLTPVERERIGDTVRISWAGESGCEEPLDTPNTAGLELSVALAAPPLDLPLRVPWGGAASHTSTGLIAIAGFDRLAVFDAGGKVAARDNVGSADIVLGLPGDRFLFGARAAPNRLELTDRMLAPLETAELGLTKFGYLRLQYFEAEQVVVAVAFDDPDVLHLFVCEVAPRLACAPMLAVSGFDPFSDDTIMRGDNGAVVLTTSDAQLIALERLPPLAELTAVTTSSATRGTIATTRGPIAWRVAHPVFKDAAGTAVVPLDDGNSLRSGAIGDRAIYCLGVDDEARPARIATGTIGPELARGSGSPLFRLIPGAFPNRCRPAPAAPAATTLRANFTYGSFLDLDRSGAITGCEGDTCDPPRAPPLPKDRGVVFIISHVPGWALATETGGRRVWLRRDAEGSFVPYFRTRESWFGAIAARGRELWAFHSGVGAIDEGALAGLDPPIHAPAICSGEEVPIEAALDSARDEFVVIGTTAALTGSFIRRVSLDGRVTDVAIPPGVGWPSSLAEILPGRLMITTSDARLLQLEGDTIVEAPIDTWDDLTTGTIESRPETCDLDVPFFPYGSRPLFRSVRGVDGVAFVSGCRTFFARVFIHAGGVHTDVIDPLAALGVTEDVTEAGGRCPNQLYITSRVDVLQGVVPYRRTESTTRFAHGFGVSNLESGDDRIVKLLISPKRALVLRATEQSSTIRVLGSQTAATFADRFVSAAENSEGVVLISTARDQLVLAR